jgi:serine phosphatase RsbU (regulator of sigma subunit)
MFKLPILIFSLLMFRLAVFSQSDEDQFKIDSLNNVVENAQHDTILIKAWNSINRIIEYSDPELYFQRFKEIAELCNKNRKKDIDKNERDFYLMHEGVSFNRLGSIYKTNNEIEKSIESFKRSMAAFKLLHDNERYAFSLNSLGTIYKRQGNKSEAIKCFTEAYQICEKNSNIEGMGYGMQNIGDIYSNLHEDKGLDYYFKSLVLFDSINDEVGVARLNFLIGAHYADFDKIDSAKYFLELSSEQFTSNGKKMNVVAPLNSLAIIQMDEGNYELALTNFKECLQIMIDFNSRNNQSVILSNLSDLYIKMGNYKLAIRDGELALELAYESGNAENIKLSSKNLAEGYKGSGNFKKAFEMLEIHMMMKDSIDSQDNLDEIIRQEYKYNYDKAHVTDSIQFAKEQEMDDLIYQKKIEKATQQRYFLFGGLMLALIGGGYIFTRLRMISKQKAIIEDQKMQVDNSLLLLEEKSKEITDSITYAKRIQQAILPPQKIIDVYLKDSFIYYKPKDVVAGDFYWMEKVGDDVFFAAADCTGHGVPGAMVSVVCNGALNRSVREFKLTDPGKILDKAREIVIEEFNKSDEVVKDGMDIALCKISGSTLSYSGAHNPLWILRNGELIETKADKQPIGQFVAAKPFTTHTTELQKNDLIYIFSDGYVDQFGGEKGKKLKSKSFRELLLKVSSLSLNDQKKMLDENFETWKGEFEQIDDICIIGVKI